MPEKFTYSVTYNVFEIVNGERKGVVCGGMITVKSAVPLTNDDIFDIVIDEENLNWYESNPGYEISISVI